MYFNNSLFRLVSEVAESVQNALMSGTAMYEAWNNHQVQLVHAAQVGSPSRIERFRNMATINDKVCQFYVQF